MLFGDKKIHSFSKDLTVESPLAFSFDIDYMRESVLFGTEVFVFRDNFEEKSLSVLGINVATLQIREVFKVNEITVRMKRQVNKNEG